MRCEELSALLAVERRGSAEAARLRRTASALLALNDPVAAAWRSVTRAQHIATKQYYAPPTIETDVGRASKPAVSAPAASNPRWYSEE